MSNRVVFALVCLVALALVPLAGCTPPALAGRTVCWQRYRRRKLLSRFHRRWILRPRFHRCRNLLSRFHGRWRSGCGDSWYDRVAVGVLVLLPPPAESFL